MRYLSIDYGFSHIGLAFAEDKLAEPYGQIKNISDQESVEKIVEICQKEKIETVIVGISEGKMAEKTEAYTDLLRERLAIPVVLFDETLSSHTAQQYLRKSGAKKKKRQTREHEIAAAIILQNYLDDLSRNLL
ncbi:MAG: Holliday junction resolvase RuvX [Patescibacteria group bacterium]|jgi:putative Holliday junction resolvase